MHFIHGILVTLEEYYYYYEDFSLFYTCDYIAITYEPVKRVPLSSSFNNPTLKYNIYKERRDKNIIIIYYCLSSYVLLVQYGMTKHHVTSIF